MRVSDLEVSVYMSAAREDQLEDGRVVVEERIASHRPVIKLQVVPAIRRSGFGIGV